MITRRDFLKMLSTLCLSAFLPRTGGSLAPAFALPDESASVGRALVSVAQGKEKSKLVAAALAPFGGMGSFVKRGDRVVIKPNAAWSRTPEEAANVDPELLTDVINRCFSAGARSVAVVEHTCDNHISALKVNGIKAAVSGTKASLDALTKSSDYVTIDVPRGKRLKQVAIAKKIHEADVFINMPIAKTHGAATLTLGMKNHMGAVEDRWFFHSNDLHQCIADVSTVLQPQITIMDATRLMLTNGPKGPGKIRIEDKVIAGTDQVALDAYATTLFGYAPSDIGYIMAAFEHSLGEIDLQKIDLRTVTL
jgi:uncharacterized protein (DUF362 family)